MVGAQATTSTTQSGVITYASLDTASERQTWWDGGQITTQQERWSRLAAPVAAQPAKDRSSRDKRSSIYVFLMPVLCGNPVRRISCAGYVRYPPDFLHMSEHSGCTPLGRIPLMHQRVWPDGSNGHASSRQVYRSELGATLPGGRRHIVLQY